MSSSLVRRGLLLLGASLFFLLTPRVGSAQSGTLTGVVLDGSTGLTLAGVSVQIPRLGRVAVSNNEGRFLLLGVPTGTHDIEALYLGYGPARQQVSVTPGQVSSLHLELRTEAISVEGVTVTGQRVGQAAALNQQLNAPTVTNVVASDQIGRFPDANIGDAMKRIPGIVVMGDQGEARFGVIRGTAPQLNSVTLNGERIPSAEAEIRSVQLDLIPSDMVSAIEVNKTLTADMDADAIGASVNIVTRSAPASERISLTAGSGYNSLSEKPMGLFSGVYARRFSDDKLGLVVSGSYLNHQLGSDNIEGEWDGSEASPWVALWEVRRYDIQRIRRSVSGSVDYRLGEGSTLTYRGMYNHRDDFENRYRLRYNLGAPNASGIQQTEVRRQLKIGTPDIKNARREDQRVQSHALSGEHLLSGAAVDWSVQYARASEERPNERYLQFRNRRLDGRVDISNPDKPSVSLLDASADTPANLGFHELTQEYQWTKDQDLNARLDLTFPMAGGKSEIQVGGRYRDKTKLRENDFYEYEPLSGMDNMGATTTADYTRASLAGGQYRTGLFPTKEFGGSLNLDDAGQFEATRLFEEFVPANFDAGETVTAGYVKLTQRLGDNATLVAGIRAENTSIDYTGNEYDTDEKTSRTTAGSASYTNLFPSAILRFDLGASRLLRAAWTNTISRPGYYDLVPYRILSREDSEMEIGNPDLKPTKSMNFDVMFEQYFTSVGLFSAGVFYKDITDFIFGYTRRDAADPVTGVVFDQLTQPLNGASASLLGFEVAFQRHLFGPVSMYGNYTYTESSIEDAPFEGRELTELPLPGTSKHTANASISYDDRRLSLRASLNFQDDFLDPDGGVGDESYFDRWYDRATTVDLNGEFLLTERARFFFEANNLTNQPLRYFQGTRSRTMQAEYYGARFQTGLKMDLR
jgi:TonB-dependent receptor